MVKFSLFFLPPLFSFCYLYGTIQNYSIIAEGGQELKHLKIYLHPCYQREELLFSFKKTFIRTISKQPKNPLGHLLFNAV